MSLNAVFTVAGIPRRLADLYWRPGRHQSGSHMRAYGGVCELRGIRRTASTRQNSDVPLRLAAYRNIYKNRQRFHLFNRRQAWCRAGAVLRQPWFGKVPVDLGTPRIFDRADVHRSLRELFLPAVHIFGGSGQLRTKKAHRGIESRAKNRTRTARPFVSRRSRTFVRALCNRYVLCAVFNESR